MKRRNFSRLLQIREHKRGKFVNPYFKHRKVKKTKRLRLLAFIAVFIIIAAPITLIASPFYRINYVTVSGLTTIPEQEVLDIVNNQLQKKRLNIFSQGNRLFLKERELEKLLHDNYQFSKLELDIKRTSITMLVEEKISEVVWVSGEEMYFLDLDGVSVRTLYDVERAQIHSRLGLPEVTIEEELPIVLAPSIPIIYDDSETNVVIGMNSINPILVQNIIDFDKGARRLLVSPKTYGVEAPGTPWLRVDTKMPYDLLFDGTKDVDEQIETLRSILQDQEDLVISEYIDLRFGNRIFVK